MRLFQCQACGQPLYFENAQCESCSRLLGFLPSEAQLVALEGTDPSFSTMSRAGEHVGASYKYCANNFFKSCNWLIPSDSAESFCVACRHNRIIPDLNDAGNLIYWRRIELAKHRLFYSLLRLNLPLATKANSPTGLAFDFLVSTDMPVMTGHLDGVVTINVSEADDAHRESQRGKFAEPYRTLLGHFRHEVAHYYWDRLVRDRGMIESFRTVFGDEQADYGASLARHHEIGAPEDWPENFVSAYASSHPWEDWAETWAHYFHIVDTLETARAFGVSTKPRISNSAPLEAVVDFDPYRAKLDKLIEAWLPLTFAFNSINRSMGLADLYPFAITPAIIVKLAFVYNQIHNHTDVSPVDDEATLKAIAAALKRGMSVPS